MKISAFQKKTVEKILEKDPENREIIEKVIKDQYLYDYRVFAQMYGYKGWKISKWIIRLSLHYIKIYLLLLRTLITKQCYFGTFNGEFGNFLSYVLPFLNYLHSKGVKIHYAGLELFKPFMVDDKGNYIFHAFYPLPDFLHEVEPDGNLSDLLPQRQKELVAQFKEKAIQSKLPFWNMNDDFFYFIVYRNWIMKGPFMKTYPLEKIYQTKKENSVVIFPRFKKGSPNVGVDWDYPEIIERIKPYFDKVYILGHPSQSIPLESYDNVEVCITADNRVLLEKCSNSRLIINQHSGTKYLGEYTNTQVLVIYKGPLPIDGILFNLVYNHFIGQRHSIHFAFTMEQVEIYCQHISQKQELCMQS